MATSGVLYEPSQPPPTLVADDLECKGISYVRVQWLDLTNIVRFRVLPIAYFKKHLQAQRPGINVACVALGLVGLSIAEGFGSAGEYVYVFDVGSLKLCPYAPGHASVMGFFQEKSASPGRELSVAICPRTLLAKVVDDLRKVSSVELLVGYETEFILLGSKDEANNHAWSVSSALYTGSIETTVMQEIADALCIAGIELQLYHAEAAPKQYEVVTGPLPPLQAADALVHTRETIYNIANKHGLRATMVPRLHMDSAGSGSHLHFSVHSTAQSQDYIPVSDFKLRACEASFLAALIEHLPSLVFLNYPTTASYGRMADGIWSGGTYACWGVESRETPLRVCNPHSPKNRNFELKTIDGTANPYLVLAGMLVVGGIGIKGNQQLLQKPIEVGRSAVELSEDERAAHGISQRLPLNISEAREKFHSSTVLRQVLGEEFVASYLNVNDALNRNLDAQEGLLVKMY